MTDPSDERRAAEVNESRENASFTSARRHVGAAGFAQRDVLEQIISAGREQISVTRALRQVVLATQTQLRTLPVADLPEEARAHAETLKGIVASSHAQIETATELREAIQRTLADVRGTPLEDVSATLLTTLGAVVRQQVEALQNIIATAVHEAGSLEQVVSAWRHRPNCFRWSTSRRSGTWPTWTCWEPRRWSGSAS